MGSSDYGGGEAEMLLMSEAKRAVGQMDFRFLYFEFIFWGGGVSMPI